MVADARLGVKITSNIAYRRARGSAPTEHPPHPIPLPRRGGEGRTRLPTGGHVGPPLRLGPRASPSSHPSPARRRGGPGFQGEGCPPATSPTDGRTRGSAATVGPAASLSRPSREGGPPLREPRYAVSGRTRGVTLTPVSGTGQARPSPVKGEGVRAPFHARYSVV